MFKHRLAPEPASNRSLKSSTIRLLIVVRTIIFTAILFTLLRPRHHRTSTTPASVAPRPVKTKSFTVQPREILPFVFNRAGLPPQLSAQIISALRNFGFDFRRIRPGNSILLLYRDNSLFQILYWRNYDSIYQIDFDSIPFNVKLTSLPIIIGSITGSLYRSLLNLGEKPSLIAAFTEIFDWAIDFFSETQPGDSFFILVPRKYVDSLFVGYAPIIAARYKGAIGEFVAYSLHRPGGQHRLL